MMARTRQANRSREDDLLAKLYQRVTERQADRFSAEYDLPAGQGRYTAWLRDQSTGAEGWDANRAVTVLYSQHYRALVRLAALLVRDVPAAEELVQASFVALHSAWPGLPGRDDAVSFLQRSVIHGSRAPQYHLAVAATDPGLRTAAGQLGESPVITALSALPDRQREAVVLRYYTGLADDQIATVMGVSTAKVQDHATRAMSVLRAALQEDGGSLPVWQVEPR